MTAQTTINGKSICLEFYSNEQRPGLHTRDIRKFRYTTARAFNGFTKGRIIRTPQYFYDAGYPRVMRGLVYHHRYRITVRLRRHKGYTSLKESVEGWPVAYDVLYLTGPAVSESRD